MTLLHRVRFALVSLTTLALGPAHAAEEPFTIAIMPDTQNLVGYLPEWWLEQCQWIVDHQAERNIKAVIHVGDLVDDAQKMYQWTNALSGLQLLKDAAIPLILAPGNHDMDRNGFCQQMTNLMEKLPQSWFTSSSNWVGGFYDETRLIGSYLLITNQSRTYLIIGLAWVPDAGAVGWARNVTEQYSNCPAIFVAHCFVDDTTWGRRAGWSQLYGIEQGYGEMTQWWPPNRVWSEWLSGSRNVFWVISGHLSTDLNSMYFSEPAADGHVITQSLCDYQSPIAPGSDGAMQLLTIKPEENLCHIETFSTHTGRILTNWNEDYTFPLYSTNQDTSSRWRRAQAAATNGLILASGFDRTNQTGFPEVSPYGLTLTGAVAVAQGGIYVNCYPAFSNMVSATDIDALTGLSNITVSIWFKATDASPSPLGILAGKFSADTAGEWYLSTIGTCTLRFALVNTNNVRVNLDVATPFALTDGIWHQIVSTYDGAIARLYLDGNILGELPFSGRLKGTRYPVSIGGLHDQTSPFNSTSTPWGWIDRARVWNRALSLEEINRFYVRDLTTLRATRTNALPGSPATNLTITTVSGSRYVLRFATRLTSPTAGQQHMVVSWEGNPVAEVSFVDGLNAQTNWIYSSVLVTSADTPREAASESLTGSIAIQPAPDPENGPVLADVSAVPFSPPFLFVPEASADGRLDFHIETYQGIAYRLQASPDLVTWTPATPWIVATETNSLISTTNKQISQEFFRVEVGF